MKDNDELVAVVDEEDNIVGAAKRREVHKDGLLHREAYVFLIPPSREGVLLQLRADNHQWDASAGGHFPVTEDYLSAAVREVHEELGIALPPEDFRELCYRRFKTKYTDETNSRFARTFLVEKLIPVSAMVLDHTEVESVRFFNRAEVYSLIKEKGTITRAAQQILDLYIHRMLR